MKAIKGRILAISFTAIIMASPEAMAQSILLLACSWQQSPQKDTSTTANLRKITFDISQISPEGLIGSPDSLRSLGYEFCIPAQAQYLTEVQNRDRTIQYYANSPGRIGCQKGQYLCIGNTHHPDWKDTLIRLANLPYIERIDQFFAE